MDPALENQDSPLLSNPFNRHLGLEPSDDPNFAFTLPGTPTYTNHLGTVHAAAQFALAEATTGAVLLREFDAFSPRLFAVVRRFEGKFRDPLRGRVKSRGGIDPDTATQTLDSLKRKGRALVRVWVEIVDDSGAVGLRATIEWYLQRSTEAAADSTSHTNPEPTTPEIDEPSPHE